MCAIFGIVGEYNLQESQKAFESLKHRGEDESHTLAEDGLFLGVHRLAITSPDCYNSQPAKSQNTTVIFNGEIYNFLELKDEFAPNVASEAELILELFLREGRDFVDRLEGMFAVAITTSSTLYLFRDRFGKKPLYYAFLGESLVFSSELRAIKTIKRDTLFDRKSLLELLFFQSFISPNTFYKNIYQLPPAQTLEFDRATKELKSSYWYSFDSFKRKQNISYSQAVTDIDTLLNLAVQKRIPKDVNFASLVSGGLDSSLVFALLTKREPVTGFAVGYSGFERYDERKFARVVAKHLNSDLVEVEMSQDDFLNSLDEWVTHSDEPLLDPASIPLWHLIKSIKSSSQNRVIFTGDGSDELFLGYRLYREYLDVEEASKLQHKNWLRNYFRANFSMNKEWERYKRVFDDKLLYRSMAELFTDLQLNLLLKQNVQDNNSLKSIKNIRERFETLGGKESIDWYSFIDIHTILAELFLKKLDRVTMAFSIEARSPFLDRDLVEYLLSLPPEVRLFYSNKALLKDVAKNYLPEEIIFRKKKGFSYPFMEWLRDSNQLEVIDEVQKELGLFKSDALQNLLHKSRNSKKFKHHIFAIFILSKWLKKHYIN